MKEIKAQLWNHPTRDSFIVQMDLPYEAVFGETDWGLARDQVWSLITKVLQHDNLYCVQFERGMFMIEYQDRPDLGDVLRESAKEAFLQAAKDLGIITELTS